MSWAVPKVVSFVLARRSRRACQCYGRGLEISRTCWTLSAPQALDESTWWFYLLQSHCRPCTSCHSVWNWTIRRNALHKPSTHFTLHIKWVKISECLKITNCKCNAVIPSMYSTCNVHVMYYSTTYVLSTELGSLGLKSHALADSWPTAPSATVSPWMWKGLKSMQLVR